MPHHLLSGWKKRKKEKTHLTDLAPATRLDVMPTCLFFPLIFFCSHEEAAGGDS
jgi:hypothetical protein